MGPRNHEIFFPDMFIEHVWEITPTANYARLRENNSGHWQPLDVHPLTHEHQKGGARKQFKISREMMALWKEVKKTTDTQSSKDEVSAGSQNKPPAHEHQK